jgi:branched-chain amino acid transport system ATP-binding protein
MPLLEVEGLRVAFGGLVANADVSLAVEAGEVVGLIGPNGAGKSTLFAALSGFRRPQAGRVRFQGRDVTGWPPEAICRLGLARTFQIVRPFSRLTVLENVMVGAFLRTTAPGEARELAREALARTGLLPLADERAAALPVAAKKRLELARAVATRPRLLLLDEVLAGLTPAEARAAADSVRAIHASGVTLLVVEHVMDVLMALAQRVVVLDRGRVIASGPPAAVSRDPAVLAAYLGPAGGGGDG